MSPPPAAGLLGVLAVCHLLHACWEKHLQLLYKTAPCSNQRIRKLQVEGGWLHGQAADVYSFGVMLWEMYSGQRAWAALNYAQVPSRPAWLHTSTRKDVHKGC